MALPHTLSYSPPIRSGLRAHLDRDIGQPVRFPPYLQYSIPLMSRAGRGYLAGKQWSPLELLSYLGRFRKRIIL